MRSLQTCRSLRTLARHGLALIAIDRLVVGLSGGIASGKSTVSSLLSSTYPVIDLDLLSRLAVSPSTSAFRAIVAHFGQRVVRDGQLDRAALGDIIFNNAEERRVLNGIVHPAVRRLMVKELVRHWLSGEKVVIVDAPLLVEAGLWKYCGAIVIVYCSEQLQAQRMASRNNYTEQEARSRLASQAPLSSKLVYADHVIDNSGSLPELERQVTLVSTKLRKQAGWTWVLSWLIPPWGLLRGLVTCLWRVYIRGVGQEKASTRRKKTSTQSEIELKEMKGSKL